MSTNDPFYDPRSIVRSFTHPDAGTAEGRCYQTADGRVWRETQSRYCGTGETLGYVKNNRIETP